MVGAQEYALLDRQAFIHPVGLNGHNTVQVLGRLRPIYASEDFGRREVGVERKAQHGGSFSIETIRVDHPHDERFERLP